MGVFKNIGEKERSFRVASLYAAAPSHYGPDLLLIHSHHVESKTPGRSGEL
jgi:hypothetical protein